jgi:hypothetical protein
MNVRFRGVKRTSAEPCEMSANDPKRTSQSLRELYVVSEELPPELLALVRKLDDSDWLFP